jgi:hypothetical protein
MLELQRNLEKVLESIAAVGRFNGADIRTLAMISEAFHCQWATYWKVNTTDSCLEPVAVWRQRQLAGEALGRHTHERRLSLNEGTAGHVWRSGKPVWSTKIVFDMCLPRSLDAKAAGLNNGVWFALKSDATVYGIVELLGDGLEEATQEALLAVEQFGASLGRLIEQDLIRRPQNLHAPRRTREPRPSADGKNHDQ